MLTATSNKAERTYSYRARSQDGEIVTGTLSGETPEVVATLLRADGLMPTAIRSAGAALPDFDAEAVRRGEAFRRIKRDDVATFCQQL